MSYSSDSTGTLLDVRAAATRRRSIRTFAASSITVEDIATILDTVRLAPSAFNVQPWRFVVVESPEVKDKLAEAAYNQPQVSSAPAVIVLYTDMLDALEHVEEVVHPNYDDAAATKTAATVRGIFATKSEAEREAWGAEQGNIALGYLLLIAEAHGYQTSPMAGFDAEKVKQLLGLPAHVRVPALVAIGRGVEEGYPHHRHGLDRIVRTA
jgi:nitroreductase